MLLLWLELKRPYPSTVLTGYWCTLPLSVFYEWLNTDRPGASLDVNWFFHYGTILDLISLIYAPLALTLLYVRIARPRVLACLALALCLLRIGDWTISGRVAFAWTRMEVFVDDLAPTRLFEKWIQGEKSVRQVFASLRWVGVIELLVLSLMGKGDVANLSGVLDNVAKMPQACFR